MKKWRVELNEIIAKIAKLYWDGYREIKLTKLELKKIQEKHNFTKPFEFYDINESAKQFFKNSKFEASYKNVYVYNDKGLRQQISPKKYNEYPIILDWLKKLEEMQEFNSIEEKKKIAYFSEIAQAKKNKRVNFWNENIKQICDSYNKKVRILHKNGFYTLEQAILLTESEKGSYSDMEVFKFSEYTKNTSLNDLNIVEVR